MNRDSEKEIVLKLAKKIEGLLIEADCTCDEALNACASVILTTCAKKDLSDRDFLEMVREWLVHYKTRESWDYE